MVLEEIGDGDRDKSLSVRTKHMLKRSVIEDVLRRLAPRMPPHEFAAVVDHALDSRGLRSATPETAAWLSLVAYVRHALTEYDELLAQGYDQDRWAGTLRYPEVPLAEARAQLRALRAANLRILRGLGPAEMQRVGMHSERGPESLAHLIKLMGAHDLVHRRQIDRVLK